MSTTIELPRGDSLELDFVYQEADGSIKDFDTVTLIIKRNGFLYTLAGTKVDTGKASFSIPPGSVTFPGNYSASISAVGGTTDRGTFLFNLMVL